MCCPVLSRVLWAAVDVDRLAGDIGGVVACEKGDEATTSSTRPARPIGMLADPFGHQFAGLVVSEQPAPSLIVIRPHIRVDDAGADGIDGDALLGDLLGEALRVTPTTPNFEAA